MKSLAFLLLSFCSAALLAQAVPPPVANMTTITTSVLVATPNVLPAFAPSNPVNANFQWSAPQINTDGTLITGGLSYAVYEGEAGTPLVQVSIPQANQNFSMTGGPEVFIPGHTYCFAVASIQNGVQSLQSAQACVKIPMAIPGQSSTPSIHT